MAEPAEGAPLDTAGHDGRFGDRFDDEISASSVVWTTAGLAVVCVLGMLITWGMQGYYASRDAVKPSPIAEANESRMPEGPLLQRDPEGELEAMRREMAGRLGGYGWVDENAGVVHIPIEAAMSLLVEQGTGQAAAAPPAEEPAE